MNGNDSSTLLLAHLNSSPLTDVAVGAVAPHALSLNGSAVINNSIFQFGGGAVQFPGLSGSNVTSPNVADLSIGTSDFTIDFWAFNPLATPTDSMMFAIGGDLNGFLIRMNFVQPGRPYVYLGGQGGLSAGWAAGIGQNTWNHMAFQRQGTTFTGFLNGLVMQQETIVPGLSIATTTGLVIGDTPAEGDTFNPWNGLMDELRISLIARYPGILPGQAFGVPSAAYGTDFGWSAPPVILPVMAQ